MNKDCQQNNDKTYDANISNKECQEIQNINN